MQSCTIFEFLGVLINVYKYFNFDRKKFMQQKNKQDFFWLTLPTVWIEDAILWKVIDSLKTIQLENKLDYFIH